MSKEWIFEHSVECAVSRQFAFEYWCDVSNWTLDEDITSVQLEGPFARGTWGVTNSKRSGQVKWRIAVVETWSVVLELPVADVTARFKWSFEDIDARTRITQRATLVGERALDYEDSIGVGLRVGIPAGMRKLCQAMEAAFESTLS